MARRLGVAIAALLVLAPSAAAHQGSPNMTSRVLAAPKGVSVQVLGGDDRLELLNKSKQMVLIRGYNGEPYARLFPNGTVQVNRLSPALYLNEDRLGRVKVPAFAKPKAKPEWKNLDGTYRFQWHDHRIHWMATGRPPIVKDPKKKTKIFNWKVGVDVNNKPAAINGDLYWTPKPGGGPPAAAIAGLIAFLLLSGALVVTVRRRREGGGGGGGSPSPPKEAEAW
jgi:hypothetical protein